MFLGSYNTITMMIEMVTYAVQFHLNTLQIRAPRCDIVLLYDFEMRSVSSVQSFDVEEF